MDNAMTITKKTTMTKTKKTITKIKKTMTRTKKTNKIAPVL